MQEHIQELIRNNPENVEAILAVPPGCSEDTWVFEHTKQFILETNLLVTELQKHCSSTTCPVMGLKNDSFKCTAHDEYQDCCAIDYMVHNLDSATDVLLNIHSGQYLGKTQEGEKSTLHQILRRLYRILAHAKVVHPGAFGDFEREMFLYRRFFHFCRLFNINQKERPIQPSG